MKKFGLALVLCLILATSISGCAKSDIGESCDTAGAVDDCVDGAICTNSSSGENFCRKSCTVQGDCAAGEACNGISGTNLKSCQPS